MAQKKATNIRALLVVLDMEILLISQDLYLSQIIISNLIQPQGYDKQDEQNFS